MVTKGYIFYLLCQWQRVVKMWTYDTHYTTSTKLKPYSKSKMGYFREKGWDKISWHCSFMYLKSIPTLHTVKIIKCCKLSLCTVFVAGIIDATVLRYFSCRYIYCRYIFCRYISCRYIQYISCRYMFCRWHGSGTELKRHGLITP